MTFAALTVALLLTTALQVRFGLAPLKRISTALPPSAPAAPSGWKANFPVEIAPLARETNALIDANREIVERARTHVGNLAHALKTPLSVIVNEAAARGNDPLAHKVLEQTDIMRDQVARQLERARLAARSSVIGTLIEVPPVVTALARTMEKLYRERDIAIDVDVPEHARFRGEQQDLEEMIGNLVDNGCKWAQSRVAIEVLADRPAAERRQAPRAHHRRRRRAGPFARRARAGVAARPTPRRDQAGLRPWPLDRGRACRAFTAACSRSAPRRSAACARSWRCRAVKPFGEDDVRRTRYVVLSASAASDRTASPGGISCRCLAVGCLRAALRSF